MLRGIIVLIQIVLCFLLQSSVFSYFELAGVVPDIALIFIVAVAYKNGQIPAMTVGMLLGLLYDVCFGDVIGISALLYLVIGFLAGFSHKIYDKRDLVIPLVTIAVGEFLYSFFYYVFEFLLRNRTALGYYMPNVILPRIVYTVAVAVIIYPLFLVISQLPKKEE